MLDGLACIGLGVQVSEDRGVTITLSDAQVARVVREASGDAGLTASLGGLNVLQKLQNAVLPLLEDHGYSRSTLRALLVLAAFPTDGTERALTDVARQFALSASTTHRYLGTWMAVGLLKQDPRSRRYRRALLDTDSARPGEA